VSTATPTVVADTPDAVRYRKVVAVVFVAALFMDILDTTIVNVALPVMSTELKGGSIDKIEWVVLSYLLSLAVFIPASGWIGDRFGTKKTFLFALAMFTAASALCATAGSINQLIGYRALQGVGGGMLTPVGTAMLFRAYPPAMRAKASTVLMIPTVIAPATGPLLGGVLVTQASWPWIFLVNIPLGIAAFIFGAMNLREHREPTAGRFDIYGFVLSGAGLALVLFALSEGPRLGWRSTTVVGTFLVGVVSFVALVLVETRIEHPMLELRLFRDRMFRTANVASFFSNGSFIGLIFLMPLYLQTLRGLSAQRSGLATFTQAIGVLIASQLVGRVLYARVGPRRLMMFGLVMSAIVIVLFIPRLTLTSSLWNVRSLMFIRGMFMAFAFIPLQAASYAMIKPADTGRASSLFSTQRQMGMAVAVAVLATVLKTRTDHYLTGGGPADVARLDAFHDAFYFAAVLAVVAAASALFIRDADAAGTMKPQPKVTTQ
jgi:EmrB/QacA subfamily drug resistance transporter